MPTIYEPTGRALEYAPLACNIYRGCANRCTYCFNVTGPRGRGDFHQEVTAVPHLLRSLERELPHYRWQQGTPKRRVLLSFGCDAYQPIDDELKMTRRALELFVREGVPFQILTKGGARAERDFDLIARGDGLLAATVLFTSRECRERWEPNAPSLRERVEMLLHARQAGITTWVSVEPVIVPDEALAVIAALDKLDAVCAYKVGKWNHERAAATIDWKKFAGEVYDLLRNTGRPYLIKQDLANYLPPGAVLNTIPADF
jgi:DNA repair photolyase